MMLLSPLLLVLSYLTAVHGFPKPLPGPLDIHLHFHNGKGSPQAGNQAGNDITNIFVLKDLSKKYTYIYLGYPPNGGGGYPPNGGGGYPPNGGGGYPPNGEAASPLDCVHGLSLHRVPC